MPLGILILCLIKKMTNKPKNNNSSNCRVLTAIVMLLYINFINLDINNSFNIDELLYKIRLIFSDFPAISIFKLEPHSVFQV